MRVIILTVFMAVAMCGCRQSKTVGGPCSYEEFNTYGRVVSVDAREDNYSVRVELNGRDIEGRSTIDLDEVIRGGISKSTIEAYDISVGQTLFFYVKQIVKGTCVPLYVVLLDEDYRGE